MADGWDPGRLGEPGQRPAPRLSPPLLLLFSPSLRLFPERSALEHFRIVCECVCACVKRER